MLTMKRQLLLLVTTFVVACHGFQQISPIRQQGFGLAKETRRHDADMGSAMRTGHRGIFPSPPTVGITTTKGSTTTRTAAAATATLRRTALSSSLMGFSELLTMNTDGGLLDSLATMDSDTAEALAGPFFGASLFPYLAFLYFLNVPENECPKGVTVGFATCLLFVFLTIPAAIAAKVMYGVSLADSDWLHGSAESLLTVTNLVTVVAFRQALTAKENPEVYRGQLPPSAVSYAPMTWLVVGLTILCAATALVPALNDPQVHTLYLGGFLDLPFSFESLGANAEPLNALSIPCWIIHVSSLVEFLVAMGLCWRWADVVGNPTWKGLTWGLLPLHSSGITACTYHLFYNHTPALVPLQALLTCIGNTTAAYAALRIALSNGWKPPSQQQFVLLKDLGGMIGSDNGLAVETEESKKAESDTLIGFEDLGDALAADNDYTFLVKLFAGCAVASYLIKYGETFFNFPYEANPWLGLSVIGIPSALNAFKWYKRSQDPRFEGWF